jgi:hypothetical protein
VPVAYSGVRLICPADLDDEQQTQGETRGAHGLHGEVRSIPTTQCHVRGWSFSAAWDVDSWRE